MEELCVLAFSHTLERAEPTHTVERSQIFYASPAPLYNQSMRVAHRWPFVPSPVPHSA